jgi:hypothetical protein
MASEMCDKLAEIHQLVGSPYELLYGSRLSSYAGVEKEKKHVVAFLSIERT